MFRRNPMFRIIWWSVFTFIADASVLWKLYLGILDVLSIIAATVMSLGLVYLIAAYRLDGPEGMKRETSDERIRVISDRARSNGFLFLFISIWTLAFLINLPGLEFLLQNISVTLAATAMLGLLVQLFSFVRYKYRV